MRVISQDDRFFGGGSVLIFTKYELMISLGSDGVFLDECFQQGVGGPFCRSTLLSLQYLTPSVLVSVMDGSARVDGQQSHMMHDDDNLEGNDDSFIASVSDDLITNYNLTHG